MVEPAPTSPLEMPEPDLLFQFQIFTHLIHTTKMRWRIERDYLELKQEVGLGHFEGRSWCGFHHHATLCIASYAFLVSERAAFPPSETRTNWNIEIAPLPESYRPRGAAYSH